MVHRHVVKTVDFSPDDRCLATGGNEGVLRIFSLDRGAETQPEMLRHVAADGSKAPFINKAVWLNTQTVCTGANDGLVRVRARVRACVCSLARTCVWSIHCCCCCCY